MQTQRVSVYSVRQSAQQLEDVMKSSQIRGRCAEDGTAIVESKDNVSLGDSVNKSDVVLASVWSEAMTLAWCTDADGSVRYVLLLV